VGAKRNTAPAEVRAALRRAEIWPARAREIRELEAKDGPSAIKRVIRLHAIDDRHRQRRLVAYRAI